MSDSDSDWPTSDEDGAVPAPPSASSLQPSGSVLLAGSVNEGKQKEEEEEAAANEEEEEEVVCPPAVVLYIPVQIMMFGTTQTTVAGATVIHNSQHKFFSISFLDATKRPLIHEVASYAEPTDDQPPKSVWDTAILPFTVSPDPESDVFLKLQDGQRRRWKVQFLDRKSALQFLCACKCIENMVRHGTKKHITSVETVSLLIGSGKKLKPKQYAQLHARLWVFPAHVSSDTVGLLTHFDAETADGESTEDILDVRISEAEDSNTPTSLGQLLHKVRIGSRQLHIIPGACAPLLADIRELGLACRVDVHGLVILFVAVDSASKKRKQKKDKKKRKEKEKKEEQEEENKENETEKNNSPPSHSPEEEQPTHQQQRQQEEEEQEQEQEEGEEGEEEKVVEDQEEEPMARVLDTLKELNGHVKALPTTQVRILKKQLSIMYESIVSQLRLDEQEEEEEEEGEEGEEKVKPKKETTVLDKEAVLSAMRDNMTNVVPGYIEMNELDSLPGTCVCLTATTRNLLDSYTHLSAAHEEQSAVAMMKPAGDAEKEARLAQQIEDLERKLASVSAKEKKVAAEKKASDAQLMHLATANVEMEEKLTHATHKLTRAHTELDEMRIFEEGMKQLRTLLDNEAEARSKAEEEIEHLTCLKQKTSMRCVPKNAIDFCILCGSKFSYFGAKSKHYCMYCGRVYCRDCCDNYDELPELGIAGKARTCRACHRIKAGALEEE